MTVQSNNPVVNYTGNGVTTSFNAPASCISPPLVALNGVTLTLNSDYTLVSAGGLITTVLMTVAPANLAVLSVNLNEPFTQLTHWVEGDPFPAASHEAAADHVVLLAQQLQGQLAQAPTLPVGTQSSAPLGPPPSGTVLGWLNGAWTWVAAATSGLQALLASGAVGQGGNMVNLTNLQGAVMKLAHLASTLLATQPVLTVQKNCSFAPDTGLPNITTVFQNISDTACSGDYGNEVHVVLQAGTTANHRAYVNFNDYTGTLKWATGRNASSCWICYNTETIHRIWMNPGASGPDPSFRDGCTHINSAEGGKVNINYHPSDTTGTGGFAVWTGGTNGGGAPTNYYMFEVFPTSSNIGITATCTGTVLTVVTGAGIAYNGTLALIGPGIPNGTYIVSGGTGTGGPGTYNLSGTVPTISATTQMVLSGGATTVVHGVTPGGVGSGAFQVYGGAWIQRLLRTGSDIEVGGNVLMDVGYNVRSHGSLQTLVANNATLVCPAEVFHVTGLFSIATITPPVSNTLGCTQITIIPDAAFTTNLNGNIALASTAVVGKALIMTNDPSVGRWYPSY